MSNQVSAHQCESHGELPCPDCGYLRRGVHHRDKCPECGARGFDGDFVFSGIGTMLTGVNRAFARITRVSFTLLSGLLFTAFVNPRIWKTTVQWRAFIVPIYLLVFMLLSMVCVGSSLLLIIIKWWRAREDLSAESTVWEVTPTGVNIRERGASPLLVTREKISHIEAETLSAIMSRVTLKLTSRKMRSFSIHYPDADLKRLQVRINGTADARQRCIDEISRILAVPVTKPVVQASGLITATEA
jgi:hypothetical protein